MLEMIDNIVPTPGFSWDVRFTDHSSSWWGPSIYIQHWPTPGFSWDVRVTDHSHHNEVHQSIYSTDQPLDSAEMWESLITVIMMRSISLYTALTNSWIQLRCESHWSQSSWWGPSVYIQHWPTPGFSWDVRVTDHSHHDEVHQSIYSTDQPLNSAEMWESLVTVHPFITALMTSLKPWLILISGSAYKWEIPEYIMLTSQMSVESVWISRWRHVYLGNPCTSSPPQMPVTSKRMHNANIQRAEMTILVPNYPLMWHTIINPKLSCFKNRSENGMVTSSVSSYAPLLVKWSVLPRSPEIFLRLFPEKKTNPSHPLYPSENLTTQNTACHAWRKQCGLPNFLHNYNIPVFFLNSPEAETTV